MTAPAVVPAAPESAPAAPERASDILYTDIIDQAAAEIGAKAQPAEPARVEVPIDGEETVETQPVAGAEATPADTTVPKPPGEAAPATEEPKRQPVAEFQVFDKEGELEIPDIKLRFKANGEMREVDLEHGVKLAQQGYYNEQREQEVRQTREQLAQVNEYVQRAEAEKAAYAQAYQNMLEDENFYLQTREAYQQANSPEQQAQRLRQQLETERRTVQQERQAAQEQTQAQQFIGYLAPKLDGLTAANPNVPFDEVMGRYTMLTAPLLVAGRIPLDRFQHIAQIVDAELTPWVESQQAARTGEQKKAVAIQAATKRQLARTVAPAGTAVQAAATRPQPKQNYARAGDILNDLTNIIGSSA